LEKTKEFGIGTHYLLIDFKCAYDNFFLIFDAILQSTPLGVISKSGDLSDMRGEIIQ
jgi:hypothetical protein